MQLTLVLFCSRHKLSRLGILSRGSTQGSVYLARYSVPLLLLVSLCPLAAARGSCLRRRARRAWLAGAGAGPPAAAAPRVVLLRGG
jgi:hypothetical protein